VVAPSRASFDHIGVPTSLRHAGESWVEPTRVWVTSPRAHPFNVEWLRYEEDSPVTGPVREQPHVAYRVPDVYQAVTGQQILLEPFEVGGGFARVAFVLADGAVVELMQYADPETEGWFP
jgi:catechol 2,3-dioxygenase-like lactoylglutathione lyase family enzyme